jgi:hypothetical protein
MAIEFEINSVVSRHESDDFGNIPVIDATGSTVLVVDEDLSGDFSGANTDSGSVSRSPSVGSITGTSVTIIDGPSVVLEEGTDYEVFDNDKIDFGLGSAPYGPPSGSATVLLTYETTPISYTWSLLDKPTGSAVAVVGTGNPAIINLSALDLEGSYLVQLTLDDSLETEEVNTCIVSLDTYKKGISIIASGEESEYDADKGWQGKIEDAYLKYATQGSFRLFTLGPAAGADYNTFTDFISDVTTQDPNRAVGLNRFGEPFPASATNDFYVVQLLANNSESLTIPDGVFVDGQSFGLDGAAIILNGQSALINSLLDSTVTLTVSGPAYLDNLKGLAAFNLGPDITAGTSSADPIYINNCAFNNATFTGGTVRVQNSIFDTNINIDDSLAEPSTDVFIHQSSSGGDVITNGTVLGSLNLFGFSSSGDITNGNYPDFVVNNFNSDSPTTYRDLIEPGGPIVADTDVAITNTFYLHDLTAGAQLDFNQLLVYVDGLLMTVSTDPANGDGQDVYPGSDGSNIRFNFDLSSLMTVQVIRNV